LPFSLSPLVPFSPCPFLPLFTTRHSTALHVTRRRVATRGVSAKITVSSRRAPFSASRSLVMQRTWTLIGCILVVSIAPAARAQPASPDDSLLAGVKLTSSDGAALVDLFAKRVPGKVDPDKIIALVAQLADKDEKVYGEAIAALVKLGPAVVPYLRPAANDLDNLN